MMTGPEDKAREEIDRQLEQCGWVVQDMQNINPSASRGVAVREFPLKDGTPDYLLYAQGKVIGTVEAKPVGYSLIGAEPQSAKYIAALPQEIPHYHDPLPFAYETTGEETHFTNKLDPEPSSRRVFTFYRPEELVRLATLENQLRTKLRNLPELKTNGLWDVQEQAANNLEESLAENRHRALIQMATGSGKTFTACTFCYRLIKFAKAKRILFLVDRNNLGRQALNEFQKYTSPYSQYTFTEEFPVQRLARNAIDPASNVVITTIQRLYSMLKGEEEFEEENEEESMFEADAPLIKEALPVVYNPAIPIETFDFIVVDECHRSIYNVWRQVLEYFDAFIIGLTATPTAQTIGFFHNNLVMDYSHKKAVADGINVGYDVFRIETQVSREGATLVKKPQYFVPHRDRRTRKTTYKELDNDLTYTANQLDRDVVAEDQIRLVIRTFRGKLFTEIFTERKEVPKTLVFAKTDLHADDIVKVIREEFGKGNEFCRKITSKSTGKKPEDLLSDFRNSYFPRIAVTVDMIAAGTDIKPLECIIFMRNIKSASYFEQMKGRGVRIISPTDLQRVTSDAERKSRFVIVDAVGVCERDKTISQPYDRKPYVPLDKLLSMAGRGVASEDLVSALAARLARLNNEIDDDQQREIMDAADGKAVSGLTADLFSSIDPDIVQQQAIEKFDVPPGEEPTKNQIEETGREKRSAALKPFHDPTLRNTIIRVKSNLEQVIDEVTRDELIKAVFDGAAKDKAETIVSNFRQFVREHKDEIEALQVLYSKPYRAGLRYKHVKELAAELKKPPVNIHIHPETILWKAYETVEPDKVKRGGGKALVDLVAIVRHAIEPESPLVPMELSVEERYQQWIAEREAATTFTPEQKKWLDAIKDHIARSLYIDKDDFAYTPFSQMGGLGKAYRVFGNDLKSILSEMNEKLVS